MSRRAGSRDSPEARLDEGLAALGMAFDADTRRRLLAQLAELQKWNAAYNLTAVRDPGEMLARHLLDSLAVLPAIEALGLPLSRIADIGSGGGFPGVPLAIACPWREVTVLDSNGKKARFLRHLQRTLALPNLAVVESRAEDWRPMPRVDAVISRALAPLPDFVRLTAHLVAANGRWLAMKGKLAAEELNGLSEDVGILNIVPLQVPGLDEERHLVVVARR